MKSLILVSLCIALLGLAGCEKQSTGATNTTNTSSRRPSVHKIKITVQDERATVVMEKVVDLWNMDYIPNLEKQKDGTFLFRWYEEWHEAGFCNLKPGWIASWESIPEAVESKTDPTVKASAAIFHPTPE